MMTETMQSTEARKARPTGPKMQTTANEIAVDIVAMHKWYGDFHVLRDINLRVKRGERIIICGPSGSGKSTMIRCINRLEEHQQGRIVVDGVELTNDLKKIDEIRRAGAVHGSEDHAVRRADLGARPGDGQGSARHDGGARPGRHDHAGGEPRDGFCPAGGEPGDLHGCRPDYRGQRAE